MNKQIKGGEEMNLPYSRIPINKVKKMMELEKSPLASHYNDNRFRQKSTMTPKTRGWKYNEVSPHDALTNFKESGVLIVEKMDIDHLFKNV